MQSIKYEIVENRSLSNILPTSTESRSVLIEISEALRALGQLEQGWDDHGASPVKARVLNAVANFLNSLATSGLLYSPSLVPTREGGILIEWHTNDVDVIIDVSPDEETASYVSIPALDIEVEAPLLSIKAEANQALSYLL
jgi:hypothetical protein